MLKRVDKGLAIASWFIAGVLALMLLIGPKVVADDKGKPAAAITGGSPYAAPDGKRLFVSNCGSCHTLKEAGTNGQVGPNLDTLQLTAGDIKATMKAGPGVAVVQLAAGSQRRRDCEVRRVVDQSIGMSST